MGIKTFWRRLGRTSGLARFALDVSERLRLTTSVGPPETLFVELASACNLRCPLCPTGIQVLDRAHEFMAWDVFQKSIDDAAPFVNRICFNMWGETLLHPEVTRFVRYARDNSTAFLSINTNGNINKDEAWYDELVASGLDDLLIDCDGADQETYESYRWRGKLDLVRTFIESVSAARKRAGSETPALRALIVVNSKNEGQLDEIQAKLTTWGIEKIEIRQVGILGMPSGVETETFKEYVSSKDLENDVYGVDQEGGIGFITGNEEPQKIACPSLWRQLHVNAQGDVVPCCKSFLKSDAIGSVDGDGPLSTWFSKKMSAYRKQNLDDPLSIDVCQKCYFINGVRGVVGREVSPLRNHVPAREPAE